MAGTQIRSAPTQAEELAALLSGGMGPGGQGVLDVGIRSGVQATDMAFAG